MRPVHASGRSVWLPIGATFVVVSFLLAATRGAEVTPPSPVPRDRLITVTYADGGSAFVIGMVGGKFVQVDSHECPGALVFTGPPGSYLVIAIEGGKRSQTVIDVVDQKPPGPGPGPGPDPGPDPVVPESVLRAYGIGPTAYLEGRKTGAPAADIQRLAETYRQAAVLLHEMRLTPGGAQSQLQAARAALGGNWTAWEAAIEAKLTAAIAQHGSGQLAWRDYCQEIASALSALAPASTGRKPVPAVRQGRVGGSLQSGEIR